MSDDRAFPPEGAPDRVVKAGLFVLRLLDEAEAQGVAQDPSMAPLIAQWEARLAPLLLTARPAPPPPQLWHRIDFSTRPDNVTPGRATSSRPTWWHSAPLWRSATAGLSATTIALAVMVFSQKPLPPVPPSHWVAILQPAKAEAPALFASLGPNGRLSVLGPKTGIAADSQHDYELWILPDGETKPRSLGVLRDTAGAQIEPDARNRPAQLMVSLEPRGGSPTGAPTGPVVLVGTLRDVPG